MLIIVEDKFSDDTCHRRVREEDIEVFAGKFSGDCYSIRSSKQYLETEAAKMIYYAYYPSIMLVTSKIDAIGPINTKIIKLQK